MGQDFGQEREWSEARELDWFLLQEDLNRGLHDYVKIYWSFITNIRACMRLITAGTDLNGWRPTTQIAISLLIFVKTDKEIKLYSKRAELLTTHPAGSYELVKDAKGQLTLKITNPSQFWSVSRYLVIQVK